MKIISRGSGYSAVASAAYRSGSLMLDERTGLTHDYTRKQGVDDAVILAPADAPAWCLNRQELWNAAEKAERRKNSQLAREIELAIPRELSRDDAREAVLAFVRENFVSRGMVADVAFHHMGKANPHAHVMLSLRGIEADGFGGKARGWNDREHAESWRKSWAAHANEALDKADCQEAIDHRSYQRQGIETEPGIHLGKATCAMEKRGLETERGEQNRLINQLNLEIQLTRTSMAIRNIPNDRLDMTRAARQAAEAIHLSIPAEATSEALRKLILTLPDDCLSAWAMTSEAVSMTGDMNTIRERLGKLKAEHDKSEKRALSLKKNSPLASGFARLTAFQWVAPEYAGVQKKIRELTKTMTELRRHYNQLKKQRIPASQGAFEIEWEAAISAGIGELKSHLTKREAEMLKQEADAEERRNAQELALRLSQNDNLHMQPGDSFLGVLEGYGRAAMPGSEDVTGYILLNNRDKKVTLWGGGLDDVTDAVKGTVVTAHMTQQKGFWLLSFPGSQYSMNNEQYEYARRGHVRMYSAETFYAVLRQVCDAWPNQTRNLYRPPFEQQSAFMLDDNMQPVDLLRKSSQVTDITRAAAPAKLTPILGAVQEDSDEVDLLLVQGADETLVGVVRLNHTLYPAFAVPSAERGSLVIHTLTDNGLRFAGYGEAVNRLRNNHSPAPQHMSFTLKQREEPMFAQMYTPEIQPDALFFRFGFERTWQQWEREQENKKQRRPDNSPGMSM